MTVRYATEEERQINRLRTQREWRQRNPEKVKASQQSWYRQNHNKVLIVAKAKNDLLWNENPQLIRDRNNERYSSLKDEVYQALGNICSRCGFNDSRALQIDHVRGNGREDRKKFFSSMYRYYSHVLKLIDSGDYQILCANCNWIKRHENKESLGRPRD